MTMTGGAVKSVSVIRTGEGEAHHEHLYGTRKPSLWWIFFGRRWVRLPINLYAIEHADGLVLFDLGQDRAVVADPDFYPDRITRLFMSHIFRWHIGPNDDLSTQLGRAGYATSDVRKAVVSHQHADHVGGVAEIRQAELYAAEEGLAYMRGSDHPERHFVFRDRVEIPGAKWNAIPFAPTNDPALAPFTEAFDLMGDGSLIVLPTPGHLEGSVSMLVRRGERSPLLLIGDLTYDEQLLFQERFPAIGDKKALRESFANVRALKERLPNLVILPAHDSLAAEKLRAAG